MRDSRDILRQVSEDSVESPNTLAAEIPVLDAGRLLTYAARTTTGYILSSRSIYVAASQLIPFSLDSATRLHKVNKGSLDSQALPQQPRQAPPVGRALRILLGLVLMVYVAPVYFQVPVRVAVGSFLLVLGLIGVYSLIHIVVSRRIVGFGPCLGAVVATGLLVALYLAGASRLPILGHGEGQLAAVTFLGVSLVVAGVRAAPGCEVMAIPGLFFGKHPELACLIFSPVDKLERKLRSKHGASHQR
jgi:hypothetical protein